MKVNPTGVVAHAYILALAVIIGAAFGWAWALIPGLVGLLLLLGASA